MRVLSVNNQYIIFARKMIDIFLKCLYSNRFIKLDSFYNWRIEVTLHENIQAFQLYLLEGIIKKYYSYS